MEGTLTCVCQKVTEKREIVLIYPELQNNLKISPSQQASAFIQLQHIVASHGNLTIKINSRNITFSLIQYRNMNDIHSCDRPYFTEDFKSNTLYWRFKWSQHRYKRSIFASIHAVVNYTSPLAGIC